MTKKTKNRKEAYSDSTLNVPGGKQFSIGWAPGLLWYGGNGKLQPVSHSPRRLMTENASDPSSLTGHIKDYTSNPVCGVTW